MKKLKLNKETIATLGNKDQSKIGGGITGFGGCVNFTDNHVTLCYSRVLKDTALCGDDTCAPECTPPDCANI